MELLIDDKPIDETFEQDTTVEQAVRRVQQEVCGPQRMVIAIRCNGVDVPGDRMSDTLAKTVGTCDRLELFTGTRGKLVADAMRQASLALGHSHDECRRAAQLLNEGQSQEGIKALTGSIGLWQQIHEAVGKSIEMLQIDPATMTVNDEPLVAQFDRPRDVLLQIRDALQAQDHVLLADILQYELEEVTEQWHVIIGRLHEEAEEADG